MVRLDASRARIPALPLRLEAARRPPSRIPPDDRRDRDCIDPVKFCSCYKGDDVAMSETVAEDIKRWTAKRKSALVIEIIQGKTTVAAASRTYDLAPSEIEGWVEDARKGMENALKANPLDVRQQYEKQLKDLQEAYGEAMLELRARKKWQALMEREDGN
ncbi:MAG: DUF1153 domain-containing protein [Pseudomonadota bacterium]